MYSLIYDCSDIIIMRRRKRRNSREGGREDDVFVFGYFFFNLKTDSQPIPTKISLGGTHLF